MTSPLRVVAIVGSDTPPDQLLKSGLGRSSLVGSLEEASGRNVEISLLCWTKPASSADDGYRSLVVVGEGKTSPLNRLWDSAWSHRISRALNRTPIGRLVISLSPMDRSRIFWRAARAHPEAQMLLRSADVLLAVDLAAVKTAWIMRRATRSGQAFYGLDSAQKVFAARFRN